MILESPTCLERNLRKNWWKYQYQAKIKINFYKLAAKKTKLLFKAKQSTFLSGLLPGNQQVQVVQGEVSCFQEQQSEVRNRTDHFPRQNREITSPEIYSNTLERNLRKNWWKYQYQAKIKINFSSLQLRKPSFSLRPNSQLFLSGLLPGNQQGSASDTGRGFLFSRAAVGGKKSSRSLSSVESGNYQSRNILMYASRSQRFVFLQGTPKVSQAGRL